MSASKSSNVLLPADVGPTVSQRRASGMLREWTFQLHFAHEAARVRLQYVPQWTTLFIDPDDVADLTKLDRDVDRCPLQPFFAFRDITASDKSSEAWEEVPKGVKMYYAHVRSNDTLENFCVHCVRSVIGDPHVVEVDGDANLKALQLGRKLLCTRQLGGAPSFHFRYRVEDRANLINDYCYAIGCIVNRRGYLVTCSCARKDELEHYVSRKLIPHLADPSKLQLDLASIEYHACNYQVLREQRDMFGELQYFDREAAVGFTIPAHPATVRPDYSPTQTVGVGSLACMTLELGLFQRLLDDFADGEASGMPKHKINAAYLFLDVENVSKNDYPSVMSIDEYANLKTRRLVKTFPDAKLIGLPTSLAIGGRCGRSATATFHYDGEGLLRGCVVKAMMVSTLIGNHGVTALYFTKLGQGLFDAQLYLFQQLLRNIRFFSERELVDDFSRFDSVNIRLTDQDMQRAYSAAPQADRDTMQAHFRALQASNDGKCEGARIVVPDEAAGGLRRYSAPARNTSPSTEVEGGGGGGDDGDSALRAIATPTPPSASMTAIIIDSSKIDDGDDRTRTDASDARIPIDGIVHLTHVADWERDDVAGEGRSAGSSEAEARTGEAREAATIAALPLAAAGECGPDVEGPRGGSAVPLSEQATAGGGGGTDAGAEQQGAKQEAPAAPAESASNSTAASPASASPTSHEMSASPPCEAASGERRGAPQGQTPLATTITTNTSGGGGGALTEAERSRCIDEALHNDDSDVYFGPSLRDVYAHCCSDVRCKPNSYLLSKLPDNPRFTASILELDMSSNYLGTNGFVALLTLVGHLPRVQRLFFNDMTLTNEDVRNLCELLVDNESVTAIHLRNNPKINVAATQHLARFIRRNRRVTTLALAGTSMGAALIARLESDAAANADKAAAMPPQRDGTKEAPADAAANTRETQR